MARVDGLFTHLHMSPSRRAVMITVVASKSVKSHNVCPSFRTHVRETGDFASASSRTPACSKLPRMSIEMIKILHLSELL
jgi:hypothetical protein